ncbi:hypothetical protein LOK49_LG13G02620 [Camellia lanceoleosa]|uniref:Uncharacterized protein n=1 Tax=Camellia lanceoleosa TaxID=1840588 RepID=A0ACC0FPI2_9ERIC|nr:hypothetical protein LOK49_LG13G02620 [Camellia lanceoleosa]
MAFNWLSCLKITLLFFLIAAIATAFLTLPVEQTLKDFLLWVKQDLGPWGPLVLGVAYIPLTVLAVPASILTIVAITNHRWVSIDTHKVGYNATVGSSVYHGSSSKQDLGKTDKKDDSSQQQQLKPQHKHQLLKESMQPPYTSAHSCVNRYGYE